MAKFKFEMSKKDAMIAVKKAISGKMAILSDKNDCLTVGTPPFMTVKICFNDGELATSGSLFGKMLLGTVDSSIELADGFEKL